MALKIARAEHRNSTFLALESVRARISQNAPSADLHVDQVIDALFSPSPTGSGLLERWPDGHVFHIEKASSPLAVRAQVTLRNTGITAHAIPSLERDTGGRIQVRRRVLQILIDTRPGPADVLLDPGKRFTGFWEVTRPMREWIDIYIARAAGDPGPGAVLEVYVDDGHDTGAGYTYGVVLGGSALISEKPGLRETWVFAGPYGDPRGSTDGIGPGVRPVRVDAWLSKSNNVRLPDIQAPSVDHPAAEDEPAQ